jgi:acetoacetyl-CoA synthetase
MAADTLQRMNTATKPSDAAPYLPQIRLYQNWLRDERGLSFATYNDLWRWSVTELDAFWQSIWDYFDFQSPKIGRASCRERVYTSV